jgi:hypothetical protein
LLRLKEVLSFEENGNIDETLNEFFKITQNCQLRKQTVILENEVTKKRQRIAKRLVTVVSTGLFAGLGFYFSR